jgi:cytidylate kinase
MIITIDGPTASGKSTIAQAVAHYYSLWYLNTGYLYRALAYLLVTRYHYTVDALSKLSEAPVDQILDTENLQYTYSVDNGSRLTYQDKDITSFLKSAQVDTWASLISSQPYVRQAIVHFQQKLGHHHDLVAEGRDCGTVVFPQAEHKFFLTGSLEIRAQRWQKAQQQRGVAFSLEDAKAALLERDQRDTLRHVSPLQPAPDAYILDTTNLTPEQVVAVIVQKITDKQ